MPMKSLRVLGALVLGAAASGSEPALEHAPTPGGPWTLDAGAIIEQPAPNQWRVVTSLDEVAASRFYRMAAADGFDAIELTAVRASGPDVEIQATGTRSAPARMVGIPAGEFQMGDPFAE